MGGISEYIRNLQFTFFFVLEKLYYLPIPFDFIRFSNDSFVVVNMIKEHDENATVL